MHLVSQKDLALRLGASRKSVARLIQVGALPEPKTFGRATYWEESEIGHMIEAGGPPDDAPPAIMVKVGPATPVSDDEPPPNRAHIGWTRGLPSMDPRQIAGVDRWWAVANAEQWIGEAFIVSCVGFVVAVYQILDVDTVLGQRHFKLGEPTAGQKVYEGVRFESERGPMTKSWK